MKEFKTFHKIFQSNLPKQKYFFRKNATVHVISRNPQIRKSFFAELGFYENDTLVRIMYEDFIKGTMDSDERDRVTPEMDPKRAAFYDVSDV